MRLPARWMPLLWVMDLGITAVALAAFLTQGGFWAGDRALDRLIYSLALPWALVAWPHAFFHYDVVWLVLLPFALNSAVVAIVHVVVLVRARHLPPSGGRASSPPPAGRVG